MMHGKSRGTVAITETVVQLTERLGVAYRELAAVMDTSITAEDQKMIRRANDLIALVDAEGAGLDESRNAALAAVRLLKQRGLEISYRNTFDMMERHRNVTGIVADLMQAVVAHYSR